MSRGTLAAAAGALLGLGLTSVAVIQGLFQVPAPIEKVHVSCDPAAPVARAGQPLKLLVWNVQFGASTKHHFFYDDGDVVHVPAEDVVWTLDAIAEVVKELDPDVILFQEIDRGSDRTGRVDQQRELLARLPAFTCHASAPYHRSAYVPAPSHHHLGRVDMHLSVLSKVRLGQARRHQLPLLNEAFYRQIFNLRRAVLEVEVPVEGGPDLTLLDTHLSAFSRGDGTLQRQVEALRRLSLAAAAQGRGVILAGDMNYLPPGDDPSRLPPFAQALYPERDNPLTPLFDALNPAVPLEVLAADPERYYTYAHYGVGHTDRTIDYVFTAGQVAVDGLHVKQDRIDISDHQPILVQLRPLQAD